MKILYVIGSPDVGGTEKQLLGLVQKLGHENEITVAFLRGQGRLSVAFNNSFAKILDLSQPKSIKYPKSILVFFNLRKAIRMNNYEVIHLFLPESIIIGYLSFLVGNRKAKVIGGIRGSAWKRGKVLYFIYRKILLRLDLLICNSFELADICKRNYGIKEPKVVVISNGVEIRTPPMRGYREIRAIYVANFHDYKGHLTLVQAIKDSGMNIFIKFLGDGTNKKQTQNLVKKLKIQDQVVFLGTVDPNEVYIWANVMIHASQTEGLSNSILEGMSWGLPIIGFNVGGNSELIENSVNGYLIDEYGLKPLTETLQRLDPQDFEKMGKRSLELCMKFSWESVGEKHLKLYSDLTK
jgi:glycosyltransferase involved in cell wall biosynthesis